MDARDVQHQLERLMAEQADNGGLLYLQGDCLSEDSQARAGLRNPGPGFSLAGTASISTQMASDGPTLVVRFVVPEQLCLQSQQYNPAAKRYEATEAAGKLQASALTLCFPGHEARQRLMAQPSPMRPVLNLTS